MAESGERVPTNSPTYREFVRLYDLARQLRPTGVDRWNRELYATSGHGGFDHQTGAIGVYAPILRQGLTNQTTAEPAWQARALEEVLDRATHAGMAVRAPGEPNAVETTQSQGLNEGVASVRAATDFHAFNRMTGYPAVAFDNSRQSGAYAATNDLIQQTSGPSVDRQQLVGRLHQGPAMMHFDQLAEAVVQNRLQEVAPPEGPDRQAVRRELITTMLHPQWDSLSQRSPEAGRQAAGEIGQALNAKVDEIRQRHQHTLDGPTPNDFPGPSAQRVPTPEGEKSQVPEVPATRFLSGLAPAAAAPGWTSSPASASPPAARAPTRGTTRSQGPGEFGRR